MISRTICLAGLISTLLAMAACSSESDGGSTGDTSAGGADTNGSNTGAVSTEGGATTATGGVDAVASSGGGGADLTGSDVTGGTGTSAGGTGTSTGGTGTSAGGTGTSAGGTGTSTGGTGTSTGGAGTSTGGAASAVTGGTGTSAGGTGMSTGGAAGVVDVGGGTPSAGSSGVGEPSAGGAAGSGTGGDASADDAVFTVQTALASEVDPSAPTTVGIVTWSVNVGSIDTAYIEFGLDSDYGTSAAVNLSEEGFRTLLLGMKPERSYHFRIVAVVGTATYTSDDYVIETGAPTDLVHWTFDVQNEESRERGFIVSSYWQGNGSAVVFIVDADGEVVWWYRANTDGIARARMSADGKNMWMISASNQGAPLERVTMDALDGQVYQGTVGSHDLTPVSGVTMAYLDYGERDCNSIFEIDPSGATVEVFESSDYLDGGAGGMSCHGNALRYSQAEDVYTFSDVSQDVFIVNRQGGVDWRLTERVSGGNSAWGGTQHGHHLLDDSIVIFANRSGGDNVSGAIEYTLDGGEIMHYESGYFSANLGDVQRLPGGNTLVTYSNDSVIHEIDSQGNLVLAIDAGGSRLGYALWRETLYGPPPDLGL